MGHAETADFSCGPLAMSPQDGLAMNSFFAMPFAKRARIEVVSEHQHPVRLYYYVDYESYSDLSDDFLRFHAWWNRENPCEGVDETGLSNEAYQFGGKNTTGEGNYLILDAMGEGHYVGCHLDIHNLRRTGNWNWYGEGDDMIFVDGESWPPRLHGTGTEDYFNTAWCPTQTYAAPQHGVILPGGPNWSGRVTLYRYHLEDPVMFGRSIRVTIEHGHANRRSDDYSSTAYWYQREPHGELRALPVASERKPRPEIVPIDREEAARQLGLS
jgi:hypothetical protein